MNCARCGHAWSRHTFSWQGSAQKGIPSGYVCVSEWTSKAEVCPCPGFVETPVLPRAELRRRPWWKRLLTL